VPLDAEREAGLGQLDRLGQLVGLRYAGHDEPVADAADALVVVGLRPVDLLAGRACGERAGGQADVVVGAVERADRPAVLVVAELLGQVLAQRAAVRDVHQLHPTADPEEREVARERAARERQLERVAVGVDVGRLHVLLGAVAGGVDVDAAREHQPVEQVEHLVRLLDQQPVGREQQRHPAGALDGGDVARGQERGLLVPHAPTRPLVGGADSDDRASVHDSKHSRDADGSKMTRASPSCTVACMGTEERFAHDVDWLVIGSGFGGSVAALRLTEKGYRVGVVECGSRFADRDFPRSTWDLKRYFYAPYLGLRGIFRLTTFKDVAVVSGSGVGGGSLGYANTLYVPPRRFFEDPQWAGIEDDWQAALAPHYAEAQRMLGVVVHDHDDPADELLRELGEELGVADTYMKTPIGVFLGEAGRTVPDPYFGGAGPDRTGCILCGRCMVGCPHGAKNTLVKNYLWFAERAGATITPDRTVVDIRPLGAADGSDGYAVTHVRSGAWGRKARDARTVRARGVVVAAGALGTNTLLQRCRLNRSLPKLSKRLGELVRTNSEAVLAVTVPKDYPDDLTKRVAISGSIYPDPNTHVETVTYGRDGDSMSALYTLLVGDGTRVTRPLKLLGALLRDPLRALKLAWPRGWSRRTIIVLVMQTLDNAIALRARRLPFGGVLMRTEQDPERPNPAFIPIANETAEWLAKRTGGVAQSSLMEAFNVPTTAHILGGAVIGRDPSEGVVDGRQRVFGYENLLVCDGAAVPANVGVNPSLTITALAERAMSHIPAVAGDFGVTDAQGDKPQVEA